MNGILIDTDDEMNRRPTANPNGFFSGLAKETIARNDEALLPGSSPDVDNIREKIDGLGACGTAGVASGFFAGGFGDASCVCVELNLM